MSSKAINIVFQAFVEAKLCYAGPAWYGYTTAVDRRIEGFLRRAARIGYRSVDSPEFDDVISIAEDRLFERISMDTSHLLHQLLPAERTICVAGHITIFYLSKHVSIVQTLSPEYYIKITVITSQLVKAFDHG